MILGWLRVECKPWENPCPRCGRDTLEWIDRELKDLCKWCGHKVMTLDHVCIECLYIGPMDYDNAADAWVCPQCGAKRRVG
jgi:DNA-directed RNA polymerase subunit RPC12/RpoP